MDGAFTFPTPAACYIVHGDLEGECDYSKFSFATILTCIQPDLLVDSNDHPWITYVGLARVTQSLDSTWSSLEEWGYAIWWTVPEILNEQGTYGKEVDDFAFTMVIIEVQYEFVTYTEHWCIVISYSHRYLQVILFHNSAPRTVMLAIMHSKQLPQPTLTSKLWVLAQFCWDQVPHLRLEVSKVLKFLNSM
jgi:hypothetical protein